jgi:hypothetical protein
MAENYGKADAQPRSDEETLDPKPEERAVCVLKTIPIY